MSNYFSYFPTIEHDLKNDNTNIVTVKNILKRFKISDASLSNIQTYYDYNLTDARKLFKKAIWLESEKYFVAQ